jgi:hypothetical protein
VSFEDIKAKAKPREARARVILDGELLAEHAALDAQLQVGNESLGSIPELREVAQRIQQVERDIEASEDEFVFRSIGFTAWLELMAEHPPTPADRKIDPRVDHNPRTFPPAAIAASCVEPELSVDDAKWLMDNAPLSEWRKLWDACLTVNLGASDRPKSLTASAILRSNGTSSPTADRGESLAASS